MWSVLYKPPLTKRVGDLQWRILHGIVAVNAFISVVNPSVDDKCFFFSFVDIERLYFIVIWNV